jgi:hypothetical protein
MDEYDYSKLLEYALSDSDIRNYFDGKVNIIKYSDFPKYKDLNELVYPYNRAVILMQIHGVNFGHWCCIKKMNNILYWFDSYGMKPANSLDYAPASILKLSNSKKKYWFDLVNNTKEEIRFSESRLQKYDLNDVYNNVKINTCGRWCLLFLDSQLNEYEFKKNIKELSKKYNVEPDELVCYITYNIIGK